MKLQSYHSDHESGVIAYGLEKNGIIVLFREGWHYLYDYDKPGKQHVENMTALAGQGAGLSTYISRHVRENYKRKWREE